jgi:phospholipid/cholesterol/gamma-HCH transport system ATP-binding protein
MIEYEDVWKSFDEPVLEGVRLSVFDGEILSVVGPSGGGKSVLLKTTLGLLIPDAGDVKIFGESIVAADRDALEGIRRRVGYVFQGAALFDSMTIFENVAMGLPEDQSRELRPDALRERVREVMSEVNLDWASVEDKLPAELSGGMRKRAGLARAVIGEPQVLLYDEPVTGLDPVNSASVERLMSEIRERRGVTSVVVTHDIEGALAISDRVALLADGRIRFAGTPAAFKSSGDELVQAFAGRKAAAREAERLSIEVAGGGAR